MGVQSDASPVPAAASGVEDVPMAARWNLASVWPAILLKTSELAFFTNVRSFVCYPPFNWMLPPVEWLGASGTNCNTSWETLSCLVQLCSSPLLTDIAVACSAWKKATSQACVLCACLSLQGLVSPKTLGSHYIFWAVPVRHFWPRRNVNHQTISLSASTPLSRCCTPVSREKKASKKVLAASEPIPEGNFERWWQMEHKPGSKHYTVLQGGLQALLLQRQILHGS